MHKLISVETALKKINSAAKTMPVIPVPIVKADGYVLAEDTFAKTTLPPLDASAMDGYAVRLEARHKQGSIFTLTGEAPAGAPFDGDVGKGETVRIFTGGAVPTGANHVIMQENIRAYGENITLTEPISKSSHIRKAGIDFKKGDMVVPKGTLLDAYHIAILAASNHGTLNVYKKPKIALLANGDELVEPGSQASVGKVINSNPYALAPLLRAWGADVILSGISKDDPTAIKADIEQQKDANILVPIGGASVGKRDYMKTVFSELGYAQIFSKVAVKPGKPVWFSRLEDALVLGLPGNPASALVTAHIFLQPLIHALTGNQTPPLRTVRAATTTDLKATTWRDEFIRAHAKVGSNGQLSVTPYPRQDSSLLTPFITTNCFLRRPANTPVAKIGDMVDVLMVKAW
ncbi:MAG: gephyrin-like molybdotransferase Glp [Robiginitomaculum sp.]